MRRLLVVMLCVAWLAGCASGYTLVPAAPVSVAKGSMKVKPPRAWNRAPKNNYDVPTQENWTQNGPLLDGITFIGGIASGQAIARQKPKDDRQVPVFRSDMTPQDLVSMVESYYRIRGGATVFESTGVKPMTFLGKQAIQFDYNYVGGDEVKRLGRTVIAVVDGKLFMASLDGAAIHYFAAALPDFEALVASAAVG